MKSNVYFSIVTATHQIYLFKGNLQILAHSSRGNVVQIYTMYIFLCATCFSLTKNANIIYTVLHLAFFT